MGYIYKIRNVLNNRIYIGQTTRQPQNRFEEHLATSRQKGKKTPLHRAMKRNPSMFQLEIIEECKNDDLDSREIYWIAKYDSYNNGYNATIGGKGVNRPRKTHQ